MRQVFTDDYMTRRFDLARYNCWHLVRDVWRDMTGVDLGDLTPPRTDRASLAEAAWEATDGTQFVRLERAEYPCIVLMRSRRRQPHVGILMRRRVLHLTERGVLYQALYNMAREYESVEFYLPRVRLEGS